MPNRFKPYVGPRSSQPPHGQEPPASEAPQWKAGNERDEGGLEMPPEDKDELTGGSPPGLSERSSDPTDRGPEWEGRRAEEEDEPEEVDFELRGKDAFRSSTDYFDSNFRQPLEDSLRAFNSQHPTDSKYNSETFRKRSHIYLPKTRTVMKKNEAALCAALFSNLDLIEVSAANPSDKEQIVSAEVMQQLLQERLTVTMPWFKFALGAMQDAQTQGIVIAHSYWKYSAGEDRHGNYRIRSDRPVQDLVPMENFRFDPSAAWDDVVGTSPYLIHLMPMYIGEVKERMTFKDPKGRTWKDYPVETIAGTKGNQDESTRQARTGMSQDAAGQARDVTDYDIVWVHRHIHRIDGEDYEWYMLESRLMLSDPEPLESNVWFGERPYVVGFCNLETHRVVPASLPTLTRPLQDEANDIDNQLSDNMKFILNKAWFVKRSANVDTTSLVRNVPGRVTMVNDPDKDVKEVSWPDLPQSAFEMKNRNDASFDNLAGNFNPMTMAQTRTPRESFRTLNAVQSPAMMMTEYTLMCLVQTFLLPVLRHLVLLEQYYETDQVLLAIAGDKAKIFQRFGVSAVTDAVLEKRLSVNINIGMGATDPTTKQQRLTGTLGTMSAMAKQPIPGLELKEVFKELFALAGYRDGARFMQDGQDPEKAKLMQTVQALQKKLQELTIDKRNKHEANIVKLHTNRENAMVKLLTAHKEDDHQSRHLLIGHLLEMEKIDKQAENQRTMQAEGAMQGQAAQAQGAAQKGQLQQAAGAQAMQVAKLKGARPGAAA